MHVGNGGGTGEITPKAEEEREPRVSRELSLTFLGPFLLGLLTSSASGSCLSPQKTPLLPVSVAMCLTTHQYRLVPDLHPLLPVVLQASALLSGFNSSLGSNFLSFLFHIGGAHSTPNLCISFTFFCVLHPSCPHFFGPIDTLTEALRG